jgi:hypothetical protein
MNTNKDNACHVERSRDISNFNSERWPVNRITKHESRMTKEIRMNKIVGRLCQTPWEFFVIWSLFRHSAFVSFICVYWCPFVVND